MYETSNFHRTPGVYINNTFVTLNLVAAYHQLTRIKYGEYGLPVALLCLWPQL